MSMPEILANQVGSDQQRALWEQQLLSSGVIRNAFAVKLQWHGLTREEAGKLLGQYGFERDTPVSSITSDLTGLVFQELAYLHLKELFAPKNWRLVNPFLTGTIFKEWRQFFVGQTAFRVIPDGIVVKAQGNRAVVCGFCEYAMSPEIHLDEKYNQLLTLQKAVDFLFTDEAWSFLQTLREHRPRSWPQKLVLGKPEDFQIFYVIPQNKYLPEILSLARVVEEKVPLAWGEVVNLTKAIAQDYFGVEIK